MRAFRFVVFRLLVLALLAVSAIQARAQTNFNLTAGWNLLGNSNAASIDVATTFGDATKITTVWKWNKTASKWVFYAPSMTPSALTTYAQGKGYDVLASIAPKEGFWVNASTAVALTGPVANAVMLAESDLQQGWNLMGSADNKTPSQLNQGLSSSLNAAGKAIVTAWAWDAPNTNWKFFAPSLEAQGGTALADYISGKGYLPFSTALSASDGFWLNIGAVSPAPVATLVSIAVTPATASVPSGLTQRFVATGTYSDGSSLDISNTVTWTSDNTPVATVVSPGVGTGLASGTATITATSGSISGSTTLTVTAATLQSIAVTSANPSIPAHLTSQFTAMGAYSDGTSQNITSSVTWTSGTTAVATVVASGLATSIGVGSSVIKATSGSVSGSITLTVTAATPLPAVTIAPASITIILPSNSPQSFTISNTGSQGSILNYTVADDGALGGFLNVQNATGNLPAGSSATITVSVLTQFVSGPPTLVGATLGVNVYTPGASNFIKVPVFVYIIAATLQSIAVTPANPSIPVGLTSQFTATATDSQGNPIATPPNLQWLSSNPAIATVNSTGLVTGVTAGTANITVTDPVSGAVSPIDTVTVDTVTVGSCATTTGCYVTEGGLTWMPMSDTLYTYAQAVTLCSGWRLPTQPELSVLYTSGTMIGQGGTYYTWSSTPLGSAGYHYGVFLVGGGVTWFDDTSINTVTCVR